MLPLTATTIRDKRRALHLTQNQMARLVHVSLNTISRFELGISQSYRLRVLCSYVLDRIEQGLPINDPELIALNMEVPHVPSH